MEQQHPSLGLCFFGNQLFYAVNDLGNPKKLARIGSFDFNLDVTKTLTGDNQQQFRGIHQTITGIKEEYGVEHLRILSLPFQECWTSVPKIVYDNSDEREKHINILMSGVDRKSIQPTWYDLSNQDFRFLLLRNKKNLQNLQNLASDASTTNLISDFEIGLRWIQHVQPGGSFMTVCCFHNCISVASFILGKLRGAVHISFDDIEDLPYLWLQSTRELNWMKGLHEKIYVYGIDAYRVINTLQFSFWDDAGTVTKMDALDKMQITAEEETYGFSLEKAFPAMMLALEPHIN